MSLTDPKKKWQQDSLVNLWLVVPYTWANYHDQTAGWSPQMVVIVRGPPPKKKCPDHSGLGIIWNYSNLPSQLYPQPVAPLNLVFQPLVPGFP